MTGPHHFSAEAHDRGFAQRALGWAIDGGNRNDIRMLEPTSTLEQAAESPV